MMSSRNQKIPIEVQIDKAESVSGAEELPADRSAEWQALILNELRIANAYLLALVNREAKAEEKVKP